MFRHSYILLLGALLVSGCSEFQQAVKDAKKETPPTPRDNYIVLLDLSDRILYNNQQQVSKDLTVIKSIYEVFKTRMEVKDPTRLYYTVNDKLKVLIAPQRTTPRNLYDMVGNLRIELATEKPEKKAAAIDTTEKIFNTLLPEIYKQAVISNNSNDYTGADIWKYFSEDLDDDLEKSSNNTLFIITDGYMDFEKSEQRPPQNNRFTSCAQIISALKKYPDWNLKFNEGDYGLLPVGKKFSNLQVVLLEINAKANWGDEYSLLTKIWGKWFAEMGINSYRFVKDDNVNEVRESLEKIMQVKLAARINTVSWNRITTVDSALFVPRDAVSNATAIAMTGDTPGKKKESPLLNNGSGSSNIPGKMTDVKNPAAKKIPKPKQQVSFGPVY